jgi:quercetin dioxygenase-like cupin family protein
MRRMITLSIVLVAAGTLVAQQAAISRTVLQQADISVAGREVVTVKAEFSNGATSGRHTHPGEEVTYVLEGALTLEVEGAPTRVVKAGQAFLVPAGTVHNATAIGGTVTAVANYIVEKGKPLSTPVP